MSKGRIEVCFDNVTGLSDFVDLFSDSKTLSKFSIKGDYSVSSMENAFGECLNLTEIEGAIDLRSTDNISGLLKGTGVTKIHLKNVVNKNIITVDALTNIVEMTFEGEYERDAIKKILDSCKWDAVIYYADDILTEDVDIVQSYKKELSIFDNLELSSRNVKICGNSEIKNGKIQNLGDDGLNMVSYPRTAVLEKYTTSGNLENKLSEIENKIVHGDVLSDNVYYYKLRDMEFTMDEFTIKVGEERKIYSLFLRTPINANEPLVLENYDKKIILNIDNFQIKGLTVGTTKLTIKNRAGTSEKQITIIVEEGK